MPTSLSNQIRVQKTAHPAPPSDLLLPTFIVWAIGIGLMFVVLGVALFLDVRRAHATEQWQGGGEPGGLVYGDPHGQQFSSHGGTLQPADPRGTQQYSTDKGGGLLYGGDKAGGPTYNTDGSVLWNYGNGNRQRLGATDDPPRPHARAHRRRHATDADEAR